MQDSFIALKLGIFLEYSTDSVTSFIMKIRLQRAAKESPNQWYVVHEQAFQTPLYRDLMYSVKYVLLINSYRNNEICSIKGLGLFQYLCLFFFFSCVFEQT